MTMWWPVTWTTVLGVLALIVTCSSSASSSPLSSSSSSGSTRQLQGHILPPSALSSKPGQFFKMGTPQLPRTFWIQRKQKFDEDDGGEVSLTDFEDPDLMDFHDNAKRQYDDYGHLRFGKRALEDYDYGHMRFGRSLLPSIVQSRMDKKRAQ